MIGSVRPLARYAAPRSRMNAVGECVSRIVSGPVAAAWRERDADDGDPRDDRLERVVRPGEELRGTPGAATSEPSGLNCGSQKRFRFGSLPMMKSRRLGFACASGAV